MLSLMNIFHEAIEHGVGEGDPNPRGAGGLARTRRPPVLDINVSGPPVLADDNPSIAMPYGPHSRIFRRGRLDNQVSERSLDVLS